ncbi:uncharacterized protein LOC113207333 [Frankliniella occidentalis]|uniref:Uncharacterized protein LOC113207333 n=1 Tax=Frankliniella occidentalis TaxID=133901 RepID=A0A6J1SEL9_FRAOC|nr:uncharacterized protein LOC113207333 [Frankliniella occidentalis]
MEKLPDEMLLTVMHHLDIPTLLTCRLVSKRIGALVLHRDVWRQRVLDDEDPWLCPVLRLAPCLAAMYVPMTLPPKRHPPFATTRCAVAELRVYGLADDDEDSDEDEDNYSAGHLHTSLVIRNQEALGRLKSLQVPLVTVEFNTSSCVLLETIASTTGLERLLVSDFPGQTTDAFVEASLHSVVLQSSLKYFECVHTPAAEPFITFILAGHAETLTEVYLEAAGGSYDYCSSSTCSMAAALAGLPALQQLTCSPLPGMGAVAACASLRQVDLNVKPDMWTTIPAAAEFLRRARHLQSVHLLFVGEEPSDVGVGLVLALNPSVQRLAIRCYDAPSGHCDPHLQALTSVLPRLRKLWKLTVHSDTMPTELLLSIKPDTNPAFKKLSLYPSASGRKVLPCLHAWLHLTALKRLLRVFRNLRINVHGWPDYCPDDKPCKGCALGCKCKDSFARIKNCDF